MESSEGYKNIQRKIKDIEQELSLCTQTITQCEQSGKRKRGVRGERRKDTKNRREDMRRGWSTGET